MKFTKVRHLALLAGALMLAGCDIPFLDRFSPEAEPVAAASVTGTPAPENTGCSDTIARYQAMMDTNYRANRVSQKVYGEVMKEISPAQQACSEGRSNDAESLIAASRKKHGYPG